MAERTARKILNVSPAVKAQWDQYKAALQREEGRAATDDDMVGAFLNGVPLWQADLMLRAYLRRSAGQSTE
jgi:hypothetical protein